MTFRTWSLIGGIVGAFAAFWGTSRAGLTADQSWTTAVTVLCMIWWILEALPTAATALIPLVVFPFAGVLSEHEAATAYGDPVVLLFMGAFMMSKGIERWGAHQKISQATMKIIGASSGRRVLFALMVTTTFGSCWMNNTAIALMMMPVAIAVAERDRSGRLAVPLLLGVAYCASIGGIATPIGTAPNGVFQANYYEVTQRTIPFAQWMVVAGSVSILTMLAAWVVLGWNLRGVRATAEVDSAGPWTKAQVRSLLIFALAAMAWITREVPFGGWSALLPGSFNSSDGDMWVAIVASLAMFIVPSGEPDGKSILDWPTAVTIPWGVLILFGGGIAIAAAFRSSGLSEVMGQAVTGIQDWPVLALIGTLCLATTFLSEVTSNTATSNILMPILGAAAVANGMDAAVFMFPATLSNSLAFMMPVGTPPNAIAYSSGRVRMIEMVRYGFVINLVGVVITTLVCWQLMPLVFSGPSVAAVEVNSVLGSN